MNNIAEYSVFIFKLNALISKTYLRTQQEIYVGYQNACNTKDYCRRIFLNFPYSFVVEYFIVLESKLMGYPLYAKGTICCGL